MGYSNYGGMGSRRRATSLYARRRGESRYGDYGYTPYSGGAINPMTLPTPGPSIYFSTPRMFLVTELNRPGMGMWLSFYDEQRGSTYKVQSYGGYAQMGGMQQSVLTDDYETPLLKLTKRPGGGFGMSGMGMGGMSGMSGMGGMSGISGMGMGMNPMYSGMGGYGRGGYSSGYGGSMYGSGYPGGFGSGYGSGLGNSYMDGYGMGGYSGMNNYNMGGFGGMNSMGMMGGMGGQSVLVQDRYDTPLMTIVMGQMTLRDMRRKSRWSGMNQFGGMTGGYGGMQGGYGGMQSGYGGMGYGGMSAMGGGYGGMGGGYGGMAGGYGGPGGMTGYGGMGYGGMSGMGGYNSGYSGLGGYGGSYAGDLMMGGGYGMSGMQMGGMGMSQIVTVYSGDMSMGGMPLFSLIDRGMFNEAFVDSNGQEIASMQYPPDSYSAAGAGTMTVYPGADFALIAATIASRVLLCDDGMMM